MNLNGFILPLLLAAHSIAPGQTLTAAPAHIPVPTQTHAAAPTFRNGQWRALLIRKDGNEIAFNFDVKDSAGKQILYLRNAAERILVDDITRDGDSLFIKFPFYESQLRSRVTPEGNLEGVWLRHLASDWLVVPLKAFYGESSRFPHPKELAVPDVTGRWASLFRSATDNTDTTFRIGEFQQTGDHVTGTFLEATGDLRYLEGAVIGDSLKLSCFDGTHAYYFTAKLTRKGLTGDYYPGVTAHYTWTAHKDANAKLEDQFAMVQWKKDLPFTFAFKDLDGNIVSLSDPKFKNKVVIIQLMGSWCPNCMDETRFLSGFYKEYRDKGVEIIALAYERSTDFPRSQASVRTFQQRFDVKYTMLITTAAVGDPQRVEKTLPQLDHIAGFPTTIFVGKSGKIEKIHTGFSGPGTGRHYEDQKQEFYTLVNDLLAAK